jgi:replication factor C subunit 1
VFRVSLTRLLFEQGIGKSTTAALLAKEAGFDVLEYNASDARSKKRLQEEGFMEISDNRNLGEFFGQKVFFSSFCLRFFGWVCFSHWSLCSFQAGQPVRSSRTLVIMDEVDGMGGGDRGGNQELIALIKKTRVPVICICNDRQKAR